MTMDSDTFCRFRTLARRIRHFYADLRPREEAVLIGRMATHDVYWQNTVIDDKTANYKVKEDVWVKGPTYPYPIGIGYMLRYGPIFFYRLPYDMFLTTPYFQLTSDRDTIKRCPCSPSPHPLPLRRRHDRVLDRRAQTAARRPFLSISTKRTTTRKCASIAVPAIRRQHDDRG